VLPCAQDALGTAIAAPNTLKAHSFFNIERLITTSSVEVTGLNFDTEVGAHIDFKKGATKTNLIPVEHLRLRADELRGAKQRSGRLPKCHSKPTPRLARMQINRRYSTKSRMMSVTTWLFN
jgi:hypothetical protein